MKILRICVPLLLVSSILVAEESSENNAATGWNIELTTSLNASATYYNDHWQGGELSSMTWVSQLQATAERQFTSRINWRNTGKIGFGQTIVQDENVNGDPVWSPPTKSTDLIDLESLLRFTLDAFVDPYVGVRILTGFLDTRDPANERYFNPVEITESAGGSRQLFGTDRAKLTTRLGVAVRQMVDRNARTINETMLRESFETDITNDGGVELVAEFRGNAREKLFELKSDLRIYEAIVSSEESESENSYWRYPDVNWENTLILNAAKYLMINLYVQALYDRQINRDVRLKGTLGAGVTLQFPGTAEAK